MSGSLDERHYAMSHADVAAEMTRRGHPMTRRTVQLAEKRALEKLRRAWNEDHDGDGAEHRT